MHIPIAIPKLAACHTLREYSHRKCRLLNGGTGVVTALMPRYPWGVAVG
ncbi:hypothetical protein [Streptomyces sp. NPDC002666]